MTQQRAELENEQHKRTLVILGSAVIAISLCTCGCQCLIGPCFHNKRRFAPPCFMCIFLLAGVGIVVAGVLVEPRYAALCGPRPGAPY